MHWIILALALPIPWIVTHLSGAHPSVFFQLALPGIAIFGAAVMLSWAAELAEHDVPQSLALAGLALIAVLPEYAVDMYFAWTAAKDPKYIAYAAANMTGANRILIGLGWPAVVWAYWWKTGKKSVQLDKHQSLDIFLLLVVTCYCFVIPIKGTMSLVDTVVLLSFFGWYLYKASGGHHAEPDLEEGPIAFIARAPAFKRRLAMFFFFFISGYSIWISAEPFAEGLLHAGRHWGIEEFLLVQWLAPLASESPEFIVALIFAWRRRPQVGLGALVSSKVNQWTLLVGMLPLAYSMSLGHVGVMHLDARQVEEILLTCAQSFFAIIVLINFNFTMKESLVLAGLFISQMFFPSPHIRYAYCALYIVLGLGMCIFGKETRQALKDLYRNALTAE